MKIKSLVLCVALCAAGAAMAQQPPAPTPEMKAAREAMHKACEADMKSLCSGKEGREAMSCMRMNNDKLSAGCKDAMGKMPKPQGAPPAQ